MPRIEKSEQVLDNFERARVYLLIKNSPGIRLAAARDELRMNNGGIGYHIYMLEKYGYIFSVRGLDDKNSRQMYPTSMSFGEATSAEQPESLPYYSTGEQLHAAKA